jgi:hypothetical protein
MIPRTREEFADYCLRALGAPVLEINIAEEQISDRIDEALQFYFFYHSDATEKTYFKHQITEEDMKNQYVTIPDRIATVSNIIPLGLTSQGSSSQPFTFEYQHALHNMHNLAYAGTMSYFYQTKTYMSMVEQILRPITSIRFNRHMNKLFIDGRWGTIIKQGIWIAIEGYIVVDPEEYNSVYNDYFLKRYATSLIKRQWAVNLKKFEGIQLPGGVTLNGQIMYDEATTELERLEEECRLAWQEPINFMVG